MIKEYGGGILGKGEIQNQIGVGGGRRRERQCLGFLLQLLQLHHEVHEGV